MLSVDIIDHVRMDTDLDFLHSLCTMM